MIPRGTGRLEKFRENGVRVGFPVPHPARATAPENPL